MSDDVPQDLLIDTESLPWIPIGEGSAMKVLRASSETGYWSSIIKSAAGSVFPAHRHLGAADFYVLEGAIEYRAGTARAGFWGYERSPRTLESSRRPCPSISRSSRTPASSRVGARDAR